ncbi:MAG TPA: Hsp70 family protein, partial [Ilumatobacteraceae bacterium]|nr:Hsp70 family protein [Ilumatobacteraceae bacterium]
MPSWILAIDFGTSYTVAASKVDDRPPEVIEIGGERRVPSVIMVGQDGEVVVGRVADDLSATHPESTLRAMKNRLGDQAPVVLDGRPHQVVALVSALLAQVYAEASRQMGEPPTEVRLTHPATWNRPRLNRLLEAAAKAGLPNPALVPEPVAAALSFASEVGVPAGAHVVVYDLGGGTFDTAVVTSNGSGFNIVGRPSGDQNIGGELFDEIIVNRYQAFVIDILS